MQHYVAAFCIFDLPELVNVTSRALLLPTFTFLKFKVDALAVSSSAGSVLVAKPVHPDRVTAPNKAKPNIMRTNGLL